MSTKHTPGPWGCIDTSYHAHDYRLTQPDGKPLALKIECNDHSEQRATARLIAAAPELLAALQEAVRLYETYALLAQPTQGLAPGKWVGDAREAIRKAGVE